MTTTLSSPTCRTGSRPFSPGGNVTHTSTMRPLNDGLRISRVAALPGYDSRVVPLHYYFLQAMDRMYAYLKSNTPLPPSQLVRTIPRGGTPGAAPLITKANVPSIIVFASESMIARIAVSTSQFALGTIISRKDQTK